MTAELQGIETISTIDETFDLDRLQTRLAELLAASRPVELNLVGMDATGLPLLQLLLSAHASFSDSELSFRVVGYSDELDRFFAQSGFEWLRDEPWIAKGTPLAVYLFAFGGPK